MRRRIFVVILALVAGLSIASETKYWELVKMEQFSKGEEFNNVVLNSKGELRLGYKYDEVRIEDEFTIWSAVMDNSGAYIVGTGSGTIYKVAEGKAVKIYATGEMLVTSMIQVDKAIYAATIPNGKIFKGEDGKWTEFAKLPCKYVWKIIPADGGGLYAATGNEGRIFKVAADGYSSVVYDTKQDNVISLAKGPAGELYMGTSGKGLLIKLENGKPTVLYNFEDAEVKSIVLSGENVYAAVNSGVKIAPSEFLEIAKKTKKSDESSKPQTVSTEPEKKAVEIEKKEEEARIAEIKRETPATPSAPVASQVWKFSGDKVQKVASFPSAYLTEIVVWGGNVIAGTSAGGKVFSIAPDGAYTQLFDWTQKQALAFIKDGDTLKAAFTGDGASVYTISQDNSTKGYYVSDALDARFLSTWGNINWKGDGEVSIQTRSGNVEKPDESWADWSEGVKSFPAKIASPKGRYLQFKINFADAAAVVKGVIIAYRNQNQKPRLGELKVETLQLPPVGAEQAIAKGVITPPHSPVKKISWKGEDDDGDTLLYRLSYKKFGSDNWFALTEKSIEAGEYSWNTLSTPDGKYIIKVEASDEQSNVPSEALTDWQESSPVIVDNTNPTVEVRIEGSKAVGVAEDATSNIAKIEYKIDAGEWTQILPQDRMYDDKKKMFDIELPKGGDGAIHNLTVRAIDQENNLGSAQAEFKY